METITIPKIKYKQIIEELKMLRLLREQDKEIDFDVETQINEGLKDLKEGKIVRLS